MQILVTGSAGFIGFHLTKKLLQDSFDVVGVDNLNDYYDTQLKKDRLNLLLAFKNYKHHLIDIESFDDLLFDLKIYKFDVIIHLAAQAGVRFSITDPFSYVRSNLVGFVNILEFMRKNKIKKLLYASSSSVYGPTNKIPFNENDNTELPESFYAATKKSNEVIAHSYSKLYQIETIGLRFFTVYGPWGRPDMALFKFTSNILNDEKIDIYNQGNHLRDFTYIDDIVDGIMLILKKTDYKNYFQILNLGRGVMVQLNDFINEIEKQLGKKARKNYLPLQKGDIHQTNADIEKAKKIYGYNPKININIGIAEFINWYKYYYKKN